MVNGWVQNDALVARVHDELNEPRSGNRDGSDVSQEGECKVEFQTSLDTVSWRWTKSSSWRSAPEITEVLPLQSAMVFLLQITLFQATLRKLSGAGRGTVLPMALLSEDRMLVQTPSVINRALISTQIALFRCTEMKYRTVCP